MCDVSENSSRNVCVSYDRDSYGARCVVYQMDTRRVLHQMDTSIWSVRQIHFYQNLNGSVIDLCVTSTSDFDFDRSGSASDFDRSGSASGSASDPLISCCVEYKCTMTHLHLIEVDLRQDVRQIHLYQMDLCVRSIWYKTHRYLKQIHLIQDAPSTIRIPICFINMGGHAYVCSNTYTGKSVALGASCTKNIYVHMCDMTHSQRAARVASNISVPWLICMCDMTHSYVCHDSFTCVALLHHSARRVLRIYMCSRVWRVWRDSFRCMTWLICVPWLIHMCAMTHSHVWHDSFRCMTWLIHMCAMTHSYVWHNSVIYVPWLIYTVPWLLHVCEKKIQCARRVCEKNAVTHLRVCHDSFIWISHGTRVNESRQKIQCAPRVLHQLYLCSHAWHRLFTNCTKNSYEWVMAHSWLGFIH